MALATWGSEVWVDVSIGAVVSRVALRCCLVWPLLLPVVGLPVLGHLGIVPTHLDRHGGQRGGLGEDASSKKGVYKYGRVLAPGVERVRTHCCIR